MTIEPIWVGGEDPVLDRVMNRRRWAPRTPAFTLVELLIVIAVIGLLAALLLPSIQAAREASRRTTCFHHSRQLVLGVMQYAAAHDQKLPPLWHTASTKPWENFSWRATLLPYVEEAPLYDRLDLSRLPSEAENETAIRQSVKIYQCPSTPESPRSIDHLGRGVAAIDLTAGAHDFAAIFEVWSAQGRGYPGAWDSRRRLPFGTPIVDAEVGVAAAERRTLPGLLRKITDGLSKTALLSEQAGKPQGLGASLEAADHSPTEGAWATSDIGSFHGNPINFHNFYDPFGFHGGAVIAMADGSVSLLPEETPTPIIVALFSREGSEIISSQDWLARP